MNKTFSFIVGSALLFQLLPVAALAVSQEGLKEQREALKQELQQKRDQLKQEVKGKREAVKQEVKEKRAALKTEIKGKEEALRQEAKEKREALHKELQDKRKAFEQEAKARKEELKKKLGEKKAERIEQFFKKMVEKFEAAIGRLDKLADRIEARLNKAAERGKDVAVLREKLKTARAKIDEARTALQDARAKYAEAVKDPDFKIAFAKVREVVDGVAKKVKEAHAALVDVINSLKGIGEEEKKAEESKVKQVEITAAGFAPSSLTISKGTTVKFVNRDSAPHWPITGIHPTHEVCPGLGASQALSKDESYSFTFNEAKTCPVHDHLNPSLTGSIVVE